MYDWLRVLASRVLALLTRRSLDQEFEQELDAHLSLLTDDNLRRGLTPEQARRAGRLRLGGMAQLRETRRELQGLPWIETLAQDVRFRAPDTEEGPRFHGGCDSHLGTRDRRQPGVPLALMSRTP